MDSKLFDVADVITCTTAEKAVLKTLGYFGGTLSDLTRASLICCMFISWNFYELFAS